MIQSFSVSNFKSYSSATLQLSPLTVLIGANASGKSNLLEAIRFLSWLAQGQKLSSLPYQLSQGNAILRGYVKDFFRAENNSFTITCRLKDSDAHLSIKIGIRKNDELHVEQEECGVGDTWLYSTTKPSSGNEMDVLVEYNNFARGGKKPQIKCLDQQAIFTQLGSAARFSEGHARAQQEIPKISITFERLLSNILFLDPVPANMRGYCFTNDKRLGGDGKQISAVLHHLWNSGKTMQDKILSFIQSLPEQDIRSVEFLEGPRGEVMLQLVETFGSVERKIDAGLLSDGTLRVLAIASALLSAPEGSMVIIEEIDNGVHPSRAKKLLESIENIAKERNLIVLLSSHNPALLDALPTDSIPNVACCFRNKIDGSSNLIRLEDVAHYPELLSQGSLGNLVTKGILERYIKNPETPETKKQMIHDWLESIN